MSAARTALDELSQDPDAARLARERSDAVVAARGAAEGEKQGEKKTKKAAKPKKEEAAVGYSGGRFASFSRSLLACSVSGLDG